MDLKIENMTCGGCAKSVTKAIQSVDSAAKIETNPAARAVKAHAKCQTEAEKAAVLDAFVKHLSEISANAQTNR